MNRNAHAAHRKCSGRRRNLFSGAFRSKIPFGSGLGQTEKSQNSPAEKVLKTQKNPAEIERFQPDLVGVSGFKPPTSTANHYIYMRKLLACRIPCRFCRLFFVCFFIGFAFNQVTKIEPPHLIGRSILVLCGFLKVTLMNDFNVIPAADAHGALLTPT